MWEIMYLVLSLKLKTLHQQTFKCLKMVSFGKNCSLAFLQFVMFESMLQWIIQGLKRAGRHSAPFVTENEKYCAKHLFFTNH